MTDELEQLYQTTYTAVVRFLYRKVWDAERAEDLAQEALAKAWRCRDSFVPGSNLKAWLFTILRNEFYSQQRRAWRQIPWDEGLVKALTSPRDEQQWALELSVTASAIDDLPHGQREALILVGVGGFSYDEAALLSRSAVGTIKSRVARARVAVGRLARHRHACSRAEVRRLVV